MKLPDRIELRQVQWGAAEIAELRDAVSARFDTTAGLYGPAECAARGGVLFEVLADGERVGLYALDVNRYPHGVEGVVAFATGRASFDLTRRVLPLIERQFVGCDVVRVDTRRRGLAAKLASLGYRFDGLIMRKPARAPQ
jgi:hypothetical protein